MRWPPGKHSWELAFSENLQLITLPKQLAAKQPFKKIKISVNMAFASVSAHMETQTAESIKWPRVRVSRQSISGAVLLPHLPSFR